MRERVPGEPGQEPVEFRHTPQMLQLWSTRVQRVALDHFSTDRGKPPARDGVVSVRDPATNVLSPRELPLLESHGRGDVSVHALDTRKILRAVGQSLDDPVEVAPPQDCERRLDALGAVRRTSAFEPRPDSDHHDLVSLNVAVHRPWPSNRRAGVGRVRETTKRHLDARARATGEFGSHRRERMRVGGACHW